MTPTLSLQAGRPVLDILIIYPISTHLCLQCRFHLHHDARVRDRAAPAPVDVFGVIEERKAQRAVGAPFFVGFKITSY